MGKGIKGKFTHERMINYLSLNVVKLVIAFIYLSLTLYYSLL